MTMLKIGEPGTVQFPMVDHAVEIGWKPLTPQDAVYQRGGEDGVFLHGALARKLREFNLWLTEDAARGIMEKLEAEAARATIEANRELLAWIRGERQWYDEGEQRHRFVHLIDFEKTDAN